MSASPPCSPPRRPLHERSNSQNNKHQIRVVPYSPPRPSDAISSISSRPVSYASAPTATPEPESSPSQPTTCSPQDDASPTPTRGKARASVSSLRRLSSASTTPDLSDSGTSDADVAHTSRPRAGSRPSSSRRKVIQLNADKTFSVLPHARSVSIRTDSLTSPPSFTTASSSFGRFSSPAFSEDYTSVSVPLTPLTERSIASASPAESLTPRGKSGPSTSSPWDYCMVGGVRKVAQTPDKKQKQPEISDSPASELPLPPLPGAASSSSAAGPSSKRLTVKTSFQSYLSSQSSSNFSERTNYKVYGQSSPVPVADLSSLPPSPTANYQVLGESSSSDPSVHDQTRPQTGESNVNYVVHGGGSSSSSLVTTRNRLRSEYSQESLVVPPLRPVKRRSLEHLGIAKSRSRDSLRRGSLSSISNILTQEATRALFASSAPILQPGGLGREDPAGSSSSNAPPAGFPMFPSYPHQWSSQLSTVMSESEGSEAASRSLSPISAPGRRSSGFNSNHSRHVLSISSSLMGLDEFVGTPSHSRSGSLDRPQAAYSRTASRDPNSGNIRLVRDHDEDGDGLADLEDLYRPSRSRLGSFLSSHSSDRNIRSSGSSRSRANSFTSAVPTWARLYYGSGERRYLAAQPSSDSMFSEFNDSQPGGSSMSRTPSHDGYDAEIHSPRRRPQQESTRQRPRGASATGSMEITPVISQPVAAVVRHIRKQTSSIWSPHLARDRRAVRYSMWDPPTAEWSLDRGLTGRRNAQITMLVIGFIFPFSWMMAALFPLPQDPRLDAAERGQNKSQQNAPKDHPANTFDEDMYENIRWWRNVNRIMAIVGLLVIGAVVALVVVGVRQRWGS